MQAADRIGAESRHPPVVALNRAEDRQMPVCRQAPSRRDTSAEFRREADFGRGEASGSRVAVRRAVRGRVL